MEAKSSVVKSKSSNSAKTEVGVFDHRNKISRSNAEFRPYVKKKRGVYVEPNQQDPRGGSSRANDLEKNQAQEKPKAPPRPKPGNKKFLASVLNILSKSTAGTQYPEENEKNSPTKKIERKYKKRTVPGQNIKLLTDADNEAKSKKRPKFRSRALNNDVGREPEQFVVLQSQKDVVHTPSIYSENDSFNWSNLPAFVKRTQQKNQEVVEQRVEEVVNELQREILEGQQSKKDKRVRIDEPKTLVSDSKVEKPDEGETNGKLYNLFVDLLESTISVYNVKQNFDKTPSETSSTKMPLEINESVAIKLNEPSEKVEKSEAVSRPSGHCLCLKELEFVNRLADARPQYVPCERITRKRYQARSSSFIRKPTPQNQRMKTESVIEAKKTFTKKHKKKMLINIFKEELRMDARDFEEPQNMYEALKVMAHNKRRCQKTIHFEETRRKKRKDTDFPECMFKTRNVISLSTKGKKKKDTKVYVPKTGKLSEFSDTNRSKSEYTTEIEDRDSYQSLEVFGYDYESQSKKTEKLKEAGLIFAYHSTPTRSNCSLGTNEMLGISDTDSIGFL